MAAYFFDSSALTKLYVDEKGSRWITELVNPTSGDEFLIVRITPIEIAAALFRRVRSGSLPIGTALQAVTNLERDLQQAYQIIEVGSNLAGQAMELAQRFGLRGYDCVQLAAAAEAERIRRSIAVAELTFVSADLELLAAARGHGFAIEDPNTRT